MPVPFFGSAQPKPDDLPDDGMINVPPPIPPAAHPGVPAQPAEPFPAEPLDAPQAPAEQPGDPGAQPPAASLVQEGGIRDPLIEMTDSLLVEIKNVMASRNRMQLAFASQLAAASYTVRTVRGALDRLEADDREFLGVMINDLRHETADLLMLLDASALRESAKALAAGATVN